MSLGRHGNDLLADSLSIENFNHLVKHYGFNSQNYGRRIKFFQIDQI